jgi:hypothetical protein
MAIETLEEAIEQINSLTTQLSTLGVTVGSLAADQSNLEKSVTSLISNNTAVIIREIQSQLAMLQKSYGSIANTYYNLFYNPIPMDVTLHIYDDETGELKTVTVANRAKAATANLTYYGSPEGNVEAPLGAVLLNTSDNTLWYKTTSSGNTGWIEALSTTSDIIYQMDALANRHDGSLLTELNASNITSGVLKASRGGTGVEEIVRKELIDPETELYSVIKEGIVKVVVDDDGKQYLVVAEPSIDFMSSSALAGMIYYVPRETAPVGSLTCNGAYYSSELYSDLYDALTLKVNGERITCPFGEEYRTSPTTGKTVLYFAVPNLAGLIIRGWCNTGDTYETEGDRTIGHIQKDGVPNITAEWSQEVTGAEANFKGAVEIATDEGKMIQVDGHTSAPAGSYDYLIKFNAAKCSSVYTDNLPEVRVRNMALLPVIKY